MGRSIVDHLPTYKHCRKREVVGFKRIKGKLVLRHERSPDTFSHALLLVGAG